MSGRGDMRVGVIGAGAIGGVVIDRLLAVGFTKNVVACEIKDDRRREIVERYGVATTTDPREAARADVVVIAVPPGAVTPVLAQIREAMTPSTDPARPPGASARPPGASARPPGAPVRPAGGPERSTLVVSFAGAVPLAHVESCLPAGTPVVRVNPNSPSIVGEGYNPVAYGRHVTGAARAAADAFLAALGRAPEVPDGLMNLYTALTAVGPTYFLPVLDALVAAGLEGGLTREAAIEAATATAQATAEMVRRRAESPEQLKLLTGLRPLKDDAVRQLVREAIQTAVARMEDVQRGIVK